MFGVFNHSCRLPRHCEPIMDWLDWCRQPLGFRMYWEWFRRSLYSSRLPFHPSLLCSWNRVFTFNFRSTDSCLMRWVLWVRKLSEVLSDRRGHGHGCRETHCIRCCCTVLLSSVQAQKETYADRMSPSSIFILSSLLVEAVRFCTALSRTKERNMSSPRRCSSAAAWSFE